MKYIELFKACNDMIDWIVSLFMPDWSILGFVSDLRSCPWKSKYESFMYDYDEKYMYMNSMKSCDLVSNVTMLWLGIIIS